MKKVSSVGNFYALGICWKIAVFDCKFSHCFFKCFCWCFSTVLICTGNLNGRRCFTFVRNCVPFSNIRRIIIVSIFIFFKVRMFCTIGFCVLNVNVAGTEVIWCYWNDKIISCIGIVSISIIGKFVLWNFVGRIVRIFPFSYKRTVWRKFFNSRSNRVIVNIICFTRFKREW